jgi:transcriptional regulator with XRE-family HTH domain/SOS-response transcriptional repressor LexA
LLGICKIIFLLFELPEAKSNIQPMEALGPKIRRQRRRLGLTLDELSGRTGISKPYLSLIETGRVPNPPSDQKLRRLEQTLAFNRGELITHAHLQRTPRDVRAMLSQLLSRRKPTSDQPPAALTTPPANAAACVQTPPDAPLDAAYLCGALAEMFDHSDTNVEPIAAYAVPVINGAAEDYPGDFGDSAYPVRVADQHVGCPGIADKDAFAARVHGDCMTPRYRQGDIVVFSPALPPRNGDDCFIRFGDGQTAFKRIFFENEGANGTPSLRLQPRNERYRPTVVPCEKVSGLYRAVYRYERLDEE